MLSLEFGYYLNYLCIQLLLRYVRLALALTDTVTIGVVGRILRMAGKPVVLPDMFSGEGNWEDWFDHFNNVAAVNKWTDEQKLLWVKVRLTGRAQTAFKKLSDADKESFEAATKALKDRFEPKSKKELYIAEFYARRKRKTEGWAEYGEDLRVLVDKAFPSLAADAKQLLALQHFMSQIENVQIAFAIRQRNPTTVEEAVRATLEFESYLQPKQRIGHITGSTAESVNQVVTSDKEELLLKTMSDILGRLEKLEMQMIPTSSPMPRQPQGQKQQSTPGRQPSSKSPTSTIVCHKCGMEGHYARGCASKRNERSGNRRPSA